MRLLQRFIIGSSVLVTTCVAFTPALVKKVRDVDDANVMDWHHTNECHGALPQTKVHSTQYRVLL
jgi:hypothetical protein